MWFKFEKEKSKGKLRIKHVQVAWYDMERNGDCFDESFIFPVPENESKTLKNIGMILPYVETVEDEGKSDRSRVFVHFDNDDVYELKMEKLSNEQIEKCSNFYLGRERGGVQLKKKKIF